MAEGQSITVSAPVEYRIPSDFPGYRVGSDGTVWTRIVLEHVSRKLGVTLVRHGDTWKPMKQTLSGGRLTVRLRCKGRVKTFFVHRLVASVFLGDLPAGLVCCHNDGNKLNNALSNLRYDTQKANEADKIRHGTHRRGDQLHNAKLNEHRVREIRNRIARGDRLVDIAKDEGVSLFAISGIKHRRNWKWVV